MKVGWFGVLAVGLLLPAVAGCVTEGESLDGQCDLWTRNTSVEGTTAHVHVRVPQADAACVEVRFEGTLVAKVPVEPGDRSPERAANATIDWPNDRFTVRTEERFTERWASEAVDLARTPHIVVTVATEELRVATAEQPPAGP